MRVTIDQDDLAKVVAQGIVSEEQADALWRAWGGEPEQEASCERSQVSRFLYYFGAMIAIGAMGWFMNTAWDAFGGGVLLALALIYALIFLAVAHHFRDKAPVLSGLLVVMAVGMTPLAVYGVEKWLGIWPGEYPGSYRGFHIWVKSGWFAMEVATLVAGLVSLRFARIPFAMAPVAFTLWYMSMDVTPLLFGPDYSWTYRKYVSIVFGLVMMAVAFACDRRQRVDYAKWLYIFGMLAFWGGLTLLRSGSEFSKAVYCAINVFLMLIGVLLERRVFLILGAIGTFGYIGYLAWWVFKDSLLFSPVLALIGLGIAYAGWIYHRKRAAIVSVIFRWMPSWLIRSLPQNRI